MLSTIGGNICLEEGITTTISSPPSLWYDVVLPIQPGCQEISLLFNGFTSSNGEENPIFLFYCGQSSVLSVGTNTKLAIVLRQRISTNSLYISACFDDGTYLHCSMYSYESNTDQKASFLWKTRI